MVHILHYPLIRRAPDIDVIEDPGLLLEVELEVRCERRPRRIELVPQQKPLPFRYVDGYDRDVVPRIVGHQALAIT